MRLVAILIALTAMIATPTVIDSAIVKVVMDAKVTVTAYTKYESCSKRKNPDCLTASGIPVEVGHAAMSRDLERKGLRFGDRIHLIGYGNFVIQDRTHARWKNRIDVYMESYQDALKFGKRKMWMVASREKAWVGA
jgi:3D (Asp-Asp-Asp) domain-containing protein